MSKEVATLGSQSVAAPTGKALGFENFKPEDIIIPRLRLLQGLSKAVTDGEGKLGQFQDSLTGDILGDKLEVVLLGMKNGAVFFKQGEGVACKSNDGETSINGDECKHCPFNEYWAKFKADGSPPKCSGSKEFMMIQKGTMADTPYPMILSFIKTSYSMGKRLASMALLSGGPIFSFSYIIGSEKIQNDKGTFAGFTLKKGKKLDDAELKIATEWFHRMRSMTVKVHEEENLMDDV